MIIEFRTTVLNDFEENLCHEVLVNGKTMMSQSEGIEPEDVRFYRDLESPHSCQAIINMVIAAVKNGEEVEIIDTEVEADD